MWLRNTMACSIAEGRKHTYEMANLPRDFRSKSWTEADRAQSLPAHARQKRMPALNFREHPRVRSKAHPKSIEIHFHTVH